MADQVEQVKAKTDIVSVIGEHVELKKAGSNFKALCPFHGEKTPSFMVSPELQIFKCFGCGESGDVISFLEKYEGMDFREALEHLAERAGIELEEYAGEGRSQRKKIFEINTQATKFYQHILLNHKKGKKAYQYLKDQRGFKNKTIKRFKLGFSPDVPLAFKKFLIDKKRYKVTDLEQAGLVYKAKGRAYDRFRGRVIFPLFDHRDNVVGFAGRVLPGEKDRAKYINTPETGAFNKSRILYGLNEAKKHIKKRKQAIIVEGEIDMISSWQAGIKNTVAIKGSALTEGQAKLLGRFTKRVVLALDADFAGDSAARRGVKIAEKGGLEVVVVRLKKYKDPDEAVREAPADYKKALENPIPVWDFIVSSVFERYDEKTGQGKAKISREIGPLLRSIEDNIVQDHYISQVADRLGATKEAVASQVLKSPGRKKQEEDPEEEKTVKSRRQLLEERLLSLAFHTEPKLLLKKKLKGLIKTSLAKRITEELEKYLKKHEKLNSSDFADKLPRELFDGFARIALKDEGELADSPDEFEKEIKLVKRDLQALDIKEKLQKLESKIKEYERKSQPDKLKKSQEKFDNLVKKLAVLRQEDSKSAKKVLLE